MITNEIKHFLWAIWVSSFVECIPIFCPFFYWVVFFLLIVVDSLSSSSNSLVVCCKHVRGPRGTIESFREGWRLPQSGGKNWSSPGMKKIPHSEQSMQRLYLLKVLQSNITGKRWKEEKNPFSSSVLLRQIRFVSGFNILIFEDSF